MYLQYYFESTNKKSKNVNLYTEPPLNWPLLFQLSGEVDNSVGLIRLAYPARLSQCVKPAQKMEDDPDACQDLDTSCVMAGWGPYAGGLG